MTLLPLLLLLVAPVLICVGVFLFTGLAGGLVVTGCVALVAGVLLIDLDVKEKPGGDAPS